ncbi:MAG TPA: DNA methyltransferase, partial [Candidatus Margulisiibacteriota bacterium]|nr:DNA methyltransferase [Candidatus Margulisiibacteriota bacterium]
GEVFGEANFCGLITFTKTGGATPRLLASISDYILWFAKDKERTKYVQLYRPRPPIENPYERYVCVETPSGDIIDLSVAHKLGREPIPEGRILRLHKTDSPGVTPDSQVPVFFEGRPYFPPRGCHWKVTARGTQHVVDVGRGFAVGKTLVWKSYRDEFPFRQISNSWDDVSVSGFGEEKLYAVQTNAQVISRCLLMTTGPGDLVLDPTCGSGTTAAVAEHWGRRWISIDTSRVPLALARQRLLTATFPYYHLKDEPRGPAGGFRYVRRQNSRGEDVGGVVPHVTLSSIAKDEPPEEEVLVDRPEVESKITRVTGAFCVEATIPTPVDWEGDGVEDSGVGAEQYGSFVDRMLEVLRKSPVLHVGGGKTVTLRNVRLPAKTLSLSAEAVVVNGNGQNIGSPHPDPLPGGEGTHERSGAADGGGSVSEPSRPDRLVGGKLIAIVFGPENGAVSEQLVYAAAREAYAKSYTHLYVIGFAIQPNARQLVDQCDRVVGVPATYVQATPDLMMGDLLKHMRSSQIFSVCGLPEIKVQSRKSKVESGKTEYQVELVGLDVFDPATMEAVHRGGNDVPAWFLDTDYNGLCFHVCQAFFPRTAAWDDLKRALKGEYEDSVWEHLAGTVSAPFDAGEHAQVAVKVIDDRGNELMVVKSLKDADA